MKVGIVGGTISQHQVFQYYSLGTKAQYRYQGTLAKAMAVTLVFIETNWF